ncbi:hypothetical protein [Azospira inquinata]|uniref:Transmembrane protein n=1 Tax=Azospira inquinata TaxID=2785627 RepID=A0A975XU67_9RHOO|nr:hypothetical protein [Azospira inquinata]QWT48481.1 hypothetical protein Azoinq_11535 [Azospira inquinata]
MRDLKELGMLLLGFMPWLLFLFVAGHTLAGLERAIWLCFFASLVFGFDELRRGFILQWGSLFFFGACLVLVNWQQNIWVATHMTLIANSALTAIMWLTLAVKRPFALQYARRDLPRERWNDPKVVASCRFITRVWAGLMSLAVGVAAVHEERLVDWPESVFFDLSLVIIVTGVAFTTLYKRHLHRSQPQASPG